MLKEGFFYLSEKAKNILTIAGKIAIIELFCETLIMYVILPPLTPYLSDVILNILDPILLVCMTAPLIAFYVINPFIVKENKLIQKLEIASTCDPLTGLFNRSILTKELSEILLNFDTNTGLGHSLLMLDLDKFKQVNDTLGHNAGDELLINVANRLRRICEEKDVICRLGGDEFAIIHPFKRGHPDYARLAEKIITCMSDDYIISGSRYSAVLSIGFTEVNSKHHSAIDILCDADIALYQAKSDCIVRAKKFDYAMKDDSDKLFKISQDIKNSVSNNQLNVHYQPIVDVLTEKMVGVEALLRWHHPQYGEVSPEFFIPIAENNGAICDLFRFLLTSVCELHKNIAQSVDKHFYISINISGSQFKYGDIKRDLYETIARYGLKPNQFRLELTESSFIDYHSHLGGSLSDMINKGFLFSLDDFGTGYSSISSLYQLPFRSIKIDKFCVQAITDDQHSQRLFDGIVNLAHTIDIPVIIEGVETKQQHEYIKKLNLSYAQGFYYSKPMPVNDFHEYIAATKKSNQPAI